jgi:serine/threonine protein kinase
MKAVNFDTMFTDTEKRLIDFVYASPSLFVCLEAEFGAQSLVSTINQRVTGNRTFALSQFGGVIAARADNIEIHSLKDMKGKILAADTMLSSGGAQMQFREMQNTGLSYINDPKQLVFTGNQEDIVKGVISGDFDVGLIRTDQIEGTKDSNGKLVDPSLLKIIDPKSNTMEGSPFPFVASTILYPEWNLGAFDFTAEDVSAEVQYAMIAIGEHSRAYDAFKECLEENPVDTSVCDQTDALVPDGRCDTTMEVAAIANQAMSKGEYSDFRTTLSYSEARNMLQDTRFISKDEDTNSWRCIRSTKLYDAISCPPGYYKKTEDQVGQGCLDAGLTCHGDYQCVCNPCVKAFEVDVSPAAIAERGTGCARMSLCGTVEQTKTLTFRARDNLERRIVLVVTVHEGSETRQVRVEPDHGAHTYEFNITSPHIGILTLEISLGGQQISQSPLRVEVQKRICDDELLEADTNGSCICKASTIAIGEKCVRYKVLIPSVLGLFAILSAIGVYGYTKRKTKEADSLWDIHVGDLHFTTPPETIGHGRFGLVLLAEYKGTRVAVKRGILPSPISDNSSSPKSSRTETYYKRISAMFDVPEDMSPVGSSSSLVPVRDDQQCPERKRNSGNRVSGMDWGQIKAFAVVQEEQYPQNEADIESNRRPFKPMASMRNLKRAAKTSTQSIGSDSHGGRTKPDAAFLEEIRVLSKLTHPCIHTIVGAVVRKTDVPLLVMEYMHHGSLYDILRNPTMVIEGEFILHMLQDIAQGVRFLHSTDPLVIHGDLRAANVLVDSKFRAKVTDFGFSRTKTQPRGTPFWMAPELLRGEGTNTTASDMYSIGIILHELYSGKDPYQGEKLEDVLPLVCDRTVNKRPPVPPSCPPPVTKLMKRLLHVDPAKRLTACKLVSCLQKFDAVSVETYRRKKQHAVATRIEVHSQVFPPHVANILFSGGRTEPEHHAIVTIFVSEIVGFANLASSLSDHEVSDMLDRLYQVFDDLARKYEVFKIESRGDGYMACTNLVMDQSQDHVKNMAEFAMAAIEAASQIPIDKDDPRMGFLQIRAGIHSGAVVSSVVGSFNPRYGLFSDTMNVSARMESTSLPGRIQCSEHSARLLLAQAPTIPITIRGQEQIKRKGDLKTFWIN